MKGTSAPQLIRAGWWRWVPTAGLERFELLHSAEGWILLGAILTLASGGGAEARYEIRCDLAWNTKRAEISVRDSQGERSLRVRKENGRWYENGRPNNTLDGCDDIDLEWSPSTNTIPIRRLRPAVGETSGILTAAWIRFPSLRVEKLPQEYRRVSERQYVYTSHNGSFTAEITVDDQDLVLDYQGFWHRVQPHGK
jgi:uncharacterized protein